MKHSKNNSNNFLNRQDQVNIEIFHAIEALGSRLKTTEGLRGSVQERLDDLESGAEVDGQTGKFYLPLVIDPAQLPDTITNNSGGSSKAIILSSFVSFFVAVSALTIALMQQPSSPTLPAGTQLTELSIPWEQGSWETVDQINQQGEQDRIIAMLLKRLDKNEQSLVELQQRQTYVENQYAKALLIDIEKVTVAEVIKEKPVEEIAQPIVIAKKTIEKKAIEVAKISPAAGQEKIIIKKSPTKPAVEKIAKKEPVKTIKKVVKAASIPKSVQKTEKPIIKKATTKKVANINIKHDPLLPDDLKELEKRAFSGNGEAQHDLGALYASGQVMNINYKLAAYWFLKAAENGVANAHYNLGVMYHQGMGLKRDVAKALYWYREAASLGHPEALYNLGIAYVEGIGTPVNTQRGIGYLKRAANVGVAQAAYNLGILYEGHFSNEKDSIKKAIKWYEYAGEMGYQEAVQSAQRLRNGNTSSMASNTQTKSQNVLELPENLNDIETAAGYELFPPVAMMEEGSGDDSSYDTRTAYPVQLVSRIQRVLIDMKLLPGNPSGNLDPKTVDAIRTFQKNNSLAIDGEPSQTLLDLMISSK